MGITLYFSNQLMPLAEKLEKHLIPKNPAIGLLEPPVVIVPNMNLSKWLKLTLARRSGIFMNVDFQYLETGLWGLLRSLADPSDPEPEMRDKKLLTVLLFFLLMSYDTGAPELAIVSRYVQRDKDAGGDREIRCWQLAEELARLFQEYEYHRSDMIQRWLADRPAEDAMENCQKRLYLDLTILKNQLAQAGGRPIRSMTEYACGLLAGQGAGQANDRDLKPVHFFGLSQISPLHLKLLSGLQSRFDIQIYSLNPSREYWEDIQTPYEKKWIRRKLAGRMQLAEDEIAAGELFSQADHPLLAAWGKPGRESIRLLCELTGYDFQARFPDPPPPDTVLAAVGYGLLTLQPVGGQTRPLQQDTSLQLVGCPGIRREVETVYNSILHNLETDPQLCMTDIAVMVSDMARYKPVVDSVFSRQPGRITYNLVDSVARTESVFAQAVLALIELAKGNFSRRQVFELLRNPCVMQCWDYGPEALAVWIAWADALGIFHDYERSVGGDAPGPRSGLFSWRQGLERLRLSRIMTVTEEADGLRLKHYQELVPFADIDTADERLVEKFCSIVEALANVLRPFKKKEASARYWRSALFGALDQFVEIATDMHGEETVYQSLVQACDSFVRYDELEAIQSGRELTVEALCAFVGAHLDGIAGGQGDYLTGGVTVAALMPMRPIPFKVVYVLGLEEGRFPGRVPESLFDLRTRRRRIGDINPAERNRYLFLEIIISVSEKLYLSYVSRDLQKDRDLAPCSVLHQLRRYVEQEVLGGAKFRICQIPIRPDSPDYIAPDAISAWSDVMVESGPVHRLSCYRRCGLWAEFKARATPADLEAADRYHPDLSVPQSPPSEEPLDAAQLTVELLRSFLLDPVAVVSRYQLGIDDAVDPTTEMAEKEDEPLGSSFPVDFIIRNLPLKYWIASQLHGDSFPSPAHSLEQAFDLVYTDLSRRSLVPDGDFATHDKARLKKQVLGTAEMLAPVVEQMCSARRLVGEVAVGTVLEGRLAAGGERLRFDPVPIPLACKQPGLPMVVEISGSLPWIWQDSDGAWHTLVVTGSNRKVRHADRHVLVPLLTFMALSAGRIACPWSDAGRMHLHVAYRSGLHSLAYRIDSRRSADYLTRLLEDFFRSEPLLWLPFEKIFDKPKLRTLIEKAVTDPLDDMEFFLNLQETMLESADMRAEMTGAVLTPDILQCARRRFRAFVPE